MQEVKSLFRPSRVTFMEGDRSIGRRERKVFDINEFGRTIQSRDIHTKCNQVYPSESLSNCYSLDYQSKQKVSICSRYIW